MVRTAVLTPQARSIVLAAIFVMVTACGGRPSPTSPEVSHMTFTLTSSAFAEGGSIPAAYTCQGNDMSPPLAWSGAPIETAAYALVVDDPDANDWVHWLIYDLPGTATSLPEDASRASDAGPQGKTTWGSVGYRGPCPPSGSHRYHFRLLALSAPLGLPTGASVEAVTQAAGAVTLAQATLTGTYRKS